MTTEAALGVSVIVPFFDEERLLEGMVREQHAALCELDIPWEIMLVDDGSSDASLPVAERLVLELEHVSLVRRTRNQGLGAAFRDGMRASSMCYVIIAPADNPIDTVNLRAFIVAAQSSDLVLGARPHREGYATWMKVGSVLLHSTYRYLLGVPYQPDYSWITLYRREIFNVIDFREDSGLLFYGELLALAARHGYRMSSVVCPMRPRMDGKGTVGSLTTVLRAVPPLLGLVLRMRLSKR
jgi:glycosyltransferase involved in cell wall biosynthesis